jgi:hypothetical protein
VIAFVVDFPASVPPVRSGGTPMVVGGAFALCTSFDRKFVCHRGTANTRPCEPPAPHDPRLGSPLEKPYPMSPGVLRSCRSSKWRALRSPRLTHTGYLDHGANQWKSPTSESPGATRTPSCLGSSAATSRTPEVVLKGGGRCALRRVPNVALDQNARPKLPHLFRSDPLVSFCTRFRQELRTQRPSLASFDARTV